LCENIINHFCGGATQTEKTYESFGQKFDMCREMYYKLKEDEAYKIKECDAWNKMQAENNA